MKNKEMEASYLKMLNDLDINGLNQINDVHFYKCEKCGTVTYVMYDDIGIPPEKIECINDGCGGLMEDAGNILNVSIEVANKEYMYTLVRPTLSEMENMREDQIKHVLKGGLIALKGDFNDVIKRKIDDLKRVMEQFPSSALIIHHNDLDGVASAAVAAKWCRGHRYGDIDYIMYTYGQEIPDICGMDKSYKTIFVVDLSFGPDTKEVLNKWQSEKGSHVVWIDHHYTAFDKEEYFEMFAGGNPFIGNKDMILGVREVGTAACVLTWRYLFGADDIPEIILALGQYDVWDKDGRLDWEDVMRIQYAARARYGLSVDKVINDLSQEISDRYSVMEGLISEGKAILAGIKERNKNECSQYAFEANLFGYKGICMNTLEFNSTTFDSVKENYDIMMPFAFTGYCFKCSLYTEKDINVGELAKKMGGGGHKKAAGFQMSINEMTEFLVGKRL